MLRVWVLLLSLVASSALADTLLPGTQASKLTLSAVETITADALAVQLIDLQIDRLESMLSSTAGAWVLTAVGTVGVTFGGVLAAIAAVGLNPIAMIVGALIAGPCSVPLTIGLVWLVSNLAHNGHIEAAILELKHERATLVPIASF
ncbi:MAG: hypothetical protein ACO1OB_08045 [Archangium sp.]